MALIQGNFVRKEVFHLLIYLFIYHLHLNRSLTHKYAEPIYVIQIISPLCF